MKFFASTTAFGLDISDFALRIVDLERKRGKFILNSFNEVKVPAGDIVEGEIKNPKRVSELINQLIKTARGEKNLKKEVVSVLPETKTFIKLIEVKNTAPENLSSVIKEELKKHIPLDIEEVYLDWQVISSGKGSIKVLTGVAPKNIVDSYLTILRQIDLIPLVLEIEAAAITRALTSEDDNKAKILIDIGAARTGLIVFDQKVVQFTVSLPISGEKITQEISETLKLDYKKAEKAKFVCGLDKTKCKGALRKILFGTMDNLIAEINKTISFYKNHFPAGHEISEMILCGGGAYLLKIDKYLNHRLDLPVSSGNPLQFLQKDNLKQIKFPINKSLSYTTAIGLALRGTQKDNLI